jgi:RHS repeat-associated protein
MLARALFLYHPRMARTAPAPNIPPIPGMCPSIAVLAGGGDGGGGSGDGAGDGSGDDHAGTGKDGQNADADGRGAPDYEKYPECGYASHPVDVVTGRAFTHPIVDLYLPGPLPLELSRMYSSKSAHLDMGMGHGWAHTFGWRVEVRRRSVVVWNEQGVGVDFPALRQGDTVIGPWGWVLRREVWGYAVDADDGVWRLFSATEGVAATDGSSAGQVHLLTAIEDRNRNRIALTYDDGRLVEVIDSAGRTIRFDGTREGRIAAVRVDVPGQQSFLFASYTYDEWGNLVAAQDADGAIARYEYDEDHRLVLDADRVGLTFHFRYDREGRCVESWGDYPGKEDPSLAKGVPAFLADGVTRAKGVHHCKFEYFANGYSEVADSTQVRRFFGNRRGTLDKAVEGGRVMTATYDEAGHLLARSDGKGATTTYTRDARGRVLQESDPLGRTRTTTRDDNGLPVEIVNPDGAVFSILRDRFGNALQATDERGATSSYKYDARGLCVEMVGATGGRTAATYDAHGNLTTLVEPDGATWQLTYDPLGRRTSVTDPEGTATRYGYSAGGDPVAIHNADGGVIRFEYDGEGHLVRFTDASGASREYTWGGYNRLAAARDARGHVVRCLYNREGEPVEYWNEAGARCALQYDESGNLVQVEAFDGRIIRYAYDESQRLKLIQEGGARTQIAYNLAGERVEVAYADGTSDAFDYDAMGRLSSVKGDGVEVLYTRDGAGDVLCETQVLRGEAHHVESAYDVIGERVRRSTSLGHEESIARDALGARLRTTLPGGRVVEHTRDRLGREVGRGLPRGGRIESAFDPMGRLTRRRAAAPTIHRPMRADEPEWLGARDAGLTADTYYRHSLEGEITESWDDRAGGRRYAYDPVGQLLGSIPEHARPELFRYDPAGNLHEAGEGAVAREYDPGNRLLRRGDSTYRWDELGRLVEKTTRDPATGADATWTYTWNARGALTAVGLPDGGRVEFDYDPMLRRLGKRLYRARPGGGKPTLASRTRFVWDGDVLVHESTTKMDGSDAPARQDRTFWFDDDSYEPVAHSDEKPGADASWYFYLNDPTGAPLRLLTETGEVACELSRSAWGKVEAAPGAKTSTPFRLEGQYGDVETGLSYNRYRYYDPEIGRFLSQDPLAFAAAPNFYAFGPNPIGWTDPLGLDWNYRLRDSSGKVYYHGRASDKTSPEQVMYRHANNKGTDAKGNKHTRLGPTDTLERINTKVTPDQAKGIEYAGITQGKTRTCPRRTAGQKKGTTPVRGNTDNGIGDAKLKTKEGKDRRDAGKKKLAGQNPHTMPPVSTWQRDAAGNATQVT